MIALEKVLAELKSESLNEIAAGDGNNYCLFNSNNYCLFGTQPDAGTPPETPSQPDQILNQAHGNLCII